MVEEILAAYDKLVKQENPKTRNFKGYEDRTHNPVDNFSGWYSKVYRLNPHRNTDEEKHTIVKSDGSTVHTYTFVSHPYAAEVRIDAQRSKKAERGPYFQAHFSSKPIIATVSDRIFAIFGKDYRLERTDPQLEEGLLPSRRPHPTLAEGGWTERKDIIYNIKKRGKVIGALSLLSSSLFDGSPAISVRLNVHNKTHFKPLMRLLFGNMPIEAPATRKQLPSEVPNVPMRGKPIERTRK